MGLRFSKCWVYLKVGFSDFFLLASLKRGFVNIFSQKGTLIFFSIKMASSAGVLSEIRGGEGGLWHYRGACRLCRNPIILTVILNPKYKLWRRKRLEILIHNAQAYCR